MNVSGEQLSSSRPQIGTIIMSGVGVLLIVVGAIVALGWVIQSPLLVRLIPNYPPMSFSESIGFLISGVALLFPVRTNRQLVPIVLGAIVALIGAIDLAEHFIDLDKRLDGLLLGNWLQELRPDAGYTTSATALALLLGGATFILIHLAPRRVPDIIAPLAATIISIIGLLGTLAYITDLELLLHWEPYALMAAHTAIGLALLGGTLWGRWYSSPLSLPLFAGRNDRRLFITLAFILAVVALTRILTGVGILQHRSEEDLKRYLGLALQQRIDVCQDMLRQGISSTGAIATRPGIRRELARLRKNPNDPGALDFINRAIPTFVDLGFGAIALDDAHGHRVAYAGRFANEPQLRIPVNLSRGTELIWSDGVALLRIQRLLTDADGLLGTLTTEAQLPLFSRMFDNIAGLGETAEMAVCTVQADTIRCLPTRAQPNVFDVPRQFQGKTLPIASALDGFTGISVNAIDATGARVIAAYGPIPLTGLGMVVSIRADENYHPMLEQFQRALLLTGVMVIVALSLLWKFMRPLTHALAESEKKLMEIQAQLQRSNAMLNALIKNTNDAIHFKDSLGRYTLINPAGARRLGRSPDEILGRDDAALWPEQTAQRLIEREREILKKNESYVAEEKVTAHGGVRTYMVTQAACRDDNGAACGTVNIAHDITDRRQSESLVRALSLTDDLTGLRNRGGFTTLATAELFLAQRGARTSYLFYVELKNAADIIKRFGQNENNRALKDLAQLLRQTFRESDIIARFEDAKFMVLTIDDSVDSQEQLATQLQRNVDDHNRAVRHSYQLNINIGTVRYDPTIHATLDALLADVDISQYRTRQIRQA